MTADLRARIAEAVARATYESQEWSGCNGSRWDALPDEWREARVRDALHVADVLIQTLGMQQEWALGYRDFGSFSDIQPCFDQDDAEIRNSGRHSEDQGYSVVSHYVTPWEPAP